MSKFKGWNIRTTYLYLVCFVTLIMIIVGTVQVIEATIDTIYPSPVWSPGPVELKERLTAGGQREVDPKLLEEQVRLEREREELRQKHERARRLARSLALLVVALPVYLYHWRAIQRGEGLKEEGSGQEGATLHPLGQ